MFNVNLDIESQINVLIKCSEQYEHNGTSDLTDSEYDYHYERLQKLCPDHEFFNSVGGNIDNVSGKLVKHNTVMGSLIKVPLNNINKWINDTLLKTNDKSLILSHKVDGLSLSLIYENGKLIMAKTRGDGLQGCDVTFASKHVNGVLHNINYTGYLDIRGECVKKKADFYERFSSEYANPRNFAAGTLGLDSTRINEIIDRKLDFIAYEVISEDKDFIYEMDKIEFLDSLGFQTLKETTKKTKDILELSQIENAINIYMNDVGNKRKDLEYEIDGIVLKTNNIKYGKSLGSINNNTRQKSACALKFPPPECITKLIGVESCTSRTGRLVPVAQLEPVNLSGAIIKKASLHNYAALVGIDSIKIGAIVKIVKKGDIIPQIESIISNGDIDITLPTECSSCGMKVIWNESKVDLICENINCPSQLSKRIVNWFSVLGNKGLGDGIINKLISLNFHNEQIIKNISDMYLKLHRNNENEQYNYLKNYFGPVAYENILKSIHSVKEVPLHTFIEALGIAKIGSMSKDIVEKCETIENIDSLTVNDLQEIVGFGPIKAKNFIDGWKQMRNEISLLLECISIKNNVKSSSKLLNKKFCFTGTFSKGRTELEKIVVDNGGKCSSVGKDTILVWDGEIDGSKLEKAKKLNCIIINEKQFFEMLN